MAKEYKRGDESLIKRIVSNKHILKHYKGSSKDLVKTFNEIAGLPVVNVKLPNVPEDWDALSADEGMDLIYNAFFDDMVYYLGKGAGGSDVDLFIRFNKVNEEVISFLIYGSELVEFDRKAATIKLPFLIEGSVVRKTGDADGVTYHTVMVSPSNNIVSDAMIGIFKNSKGILSENQLKSTKDLLDVYLASSSEDEKDRLSKFCGRGKMDYSNLVDGYGVMHFILFGISKRMLWLHRNDYFSVEVRKAAGNKKSKPTGVRNITGPAVRMIKKKTFDGLVGGSESPDLDAPAVNSHRRRGYWVTLKADRYRNHPKFGVKNGVYRKEAWVGPREAVSSGLIYKIID